MSKKNRGVMGMLIAGVLLLVVAAVLARCGDRRLGVTVMPEVKPVEFPRQRAVREERQARRAQPTNAPPAPTPTTAKRDRLTRALSSPGGGGAVVFEVNALRHSPLVDALLTCRRQQRGDEMDGLDLLKSELGVDVTEDVDRVALDAEVLAVSGFFGKLTLPAEVGEGEAYGDGARLYEMKGDRGEPVYLAKVGDDLIMTGSDPAQIKAAIDRAEGRAEAPTSFPEGVVGGEVYGTIGPELLQGLAGLGGGSADMSGLAQTLTTAKVRMAVDDNAALSLDIGTKGPAEGQELARALGGVVAMARSQAVADGRMELAAMLEQAVVMPRDDGTIAFDIAVPGAELLKAMGCPAAPATTTP